MQQLKSSNLVFYELPQRKFDIEDYPSIYQTGMPTSSKKELSQKENKQNFQVQRRNTKRKQSKLGNRKQK